MDLLMFGIFLSVTCSIVQGLTPSCCFTTPSRFPLRLLRKVDNYEVQTSDGDCQIDALVLHVRWRRICAHPKVEKILRRIKSRRQKMSQKITSDVRE
nr:C-C motif chemokine 27-like [Misgurnus anguillicaudatus]